MAMVNSSQALGHIIALAPICQQSNNWTPLLAYIDGLKERAIALREDLSNVSWGIAPRSKPTRVKKAAGGSNTTAALSYFEQHPTVSLTQAQLREVSPFRNWRPNILGSTLSRLTKTGQLTKTGNSYKFGNVSRKLVSGNGPKRNRKAANRETAAASTATQPIAATG